MLLIDHHESEIPEGHIPSEEAVGSDHAVDLSSLEVLKDRFFFLPCRNPCQDADLHSEFLESLPQRLMVFICEDDQRRDEGGLLLIEKAAVDRIHGDFRLPKSHISYEHPIHRFVVFHILKRLLDRDLLVGGIGVGEGLTETALRFRIRSEGKSMA